MESRRIGVANHGEGELIVYVEPWAESILLKPGESKEIEARGKKGTPWFNVVYNEGPSIQIYLEDAEDFSVNPGSGI